MAKVEFAPGIESVTGILTGTDPYYLRRYPKSGGGVMHIAQARPNRSGHVPSAAERTARIVFGEKYGRQKHEEYVNKILHNQLSIDFGD
jgi:hypothetical protein